MFKGPVSVSLPHRVPGAEGTAEGKQQGLCPWGRQASSRVQRPLSRTVNTPYVRRVPFATEDREAEEGRKGGGWDLNMACWQGLELVGLLRAVVRTLALTLPGRSQGRALSRVQA